MSEDLATYLRRKSIFGNPFMGQVEDFSVPQPDEVNNPPDNLIPVDPRSGVSTEDPAIAAYRNLLGQEPKLSEYHPSKGRTALGIILGAIAGAGRAPGAENVKSEIEYGPFRRRMEEFQQKSGFAAKQASFAQALEKMRSEEEARKAGILKTGAETTNLGARTNLTTRQTNVLPPDYETSVAGQAFVRQAGMQPKTAQPFDTALQSWIAKNGRQPNPDEVSQIQESLKPANEKFGTAFQKTYEAWTKQHGREPNADESAQIARSIQPTPQGSFAFPVDAQGQMLGAWNPTKGTFEPIPPNIAGARKTAQPAEIQEREKAFDNLISMAESLKVKAARRPDIFGPFGGTKNRAKIATIGSDPEATSIQYDADALAQYFYALSGKVITSTDNSVLGPIIPKMTNPHSTFMNNIGKFIEQSKRLKLNPSTSAPGQVEGEKFLEGK